MASKRCFVISPIGEPGSDIREHADAVFRGIIVPALDELRQDGMEIEPVRSDQLQEPGSISHQMFREIFHDDLCVAILTFPNPNVFYELAVAQCAYRPLVALLQETKDLPFDVADLRAVSYDLENKLRLIDKRDARALAGHLRTLLSGGWTPSDPFGSHAPPAWAEVRNPGVLQKRIEMARPQPLPPGVDSFLCLPGEPDRQIVIQTGDIRHISNIDVIVISENTDLQLARLYDPSISGTVRYLDAERGLDGRVTLDLMESKLHALISQHKLNLPVMPGTVLAIPTSGLARQGIKYVLLAAAVRGDGIGSGYSPVGDAEIQNCVRACFERYDELSSAEHFQSILFPILGSGTAKQDPERMIDLLLPAIVDSMKRTPSCKQAHLLAWVESHRSALRRVAERHGLKWRQGGPHRAADTTQKT
jgi:hypothetical protein